MNEKTETLSSAKMRTQPVGRLLFSMSVPAILSMLVQALYNVVDSVFVSQYCGEDGMTALSLAAPFQYLIVAFAVGIGVGANTQIAKKLGERKNADATRFAQTGLFLALVTALVFVVTGLFLARPLIGLFRASDAVRELGGTYLTICMSLSFGSVVEITLSKMLQATGNMRVPMISQLMGAAINLVLDPLLIFGVGFFPEMGVTGAAVATVAGQIVSMCFVLCVYVFRKHDISISPKGFRPKKEFVLGICTIGLPTMVMNAVTSFTTIAMNKILEPFRGGLGVPILGVYFKMQSFVFMPVFGLTQGLMPILSYNYGSGDKKRYARAFRLALTAAVCMMTAGLALFQFAASPIMRLFSATGDYLTEGAYALRVISISFVPAAFGITLTTMIQSLGKGVMSLVMSLLRQVVLILPIAALLGVLWGLRALWFCYPIAEIGVLCAFLPLAVRVFKKSFARLGLPDEPVRESAEETAEMRAETETAADIAETAATETKPT